MEILTGSGKSAWRLEFFHNPESQNRIFRSKFSILSAHFYGGPT